MSCLDGHYVCDKCHSFSANELIEKHCLIADNTNPIEILLFLMRNPKINMHGPEHHFLVCAVLLAAYYNVLKDIDKKKSKLILARKRAELIKGGVCGTHGCCGAGVASGIFVSLITDATPLSVDEWSKSNLMTSVSLATIAKYGGPRCCKRNSFLAILEAMEYLKKHFNISLVDEKNINCEFYELNKECKQKDCLFYKKN